MHFLYCPRNYVYMSHNVHILFLLLLSLCCDVSHASTVATTSQPSVNSLDGTVSIGITATGYIISYAIAGGIVALYFVHYIRRIVAFSSAIGCSATLTEDKIDQTGFRFCRLGQSIKYTSIAFAIWLQIAMLLSVIGHYKGIWVYDLSIPVNAVDWDSYTRMFLMAWSSSIVIGISCRVFRDKLRTFFLMPETLSDAAYVKLSQVMIDSSDPRGDMAIRHEDIVKVEEGHSRYFDFLLRRYTFSGGLFVPGAVFSRQGPKGTELEAIFHAGGVKTSTVLDRMKSFGRNEIVMVIPSLVRMTMTELSSFFYIYQISACWLPFYWDYISVGFFTLVLVLTSAMFKIIMERREKNTLRGMATLHGVVWAKREGVWGKLKAEDIVVGELICLTADSDGTSQDILADCVVVSGNAIMDESQLTGETMPIQKFKVPSNDQFRNPDEAENKKYFIFAGTTLLQSNCDETNFDKTLTVIDGTIAVVTSTGANTIRGDLIRGLLFGAPLKSLLFVELRYSLGILLIIAFIDFLSLNILFEMSMGSMLTAMYSIVGLINPLMSVALLGGELKSASRLRKGSKGTPRVFARDVHRLTIAGKVNLVLLDKTGTITKSGLDFYGLVPPNSEAVNQCAGIGSIASVLKDLSSALALAHTVSKCGDRLVGHQVELRMVEMAKAIGWTMGPNLENRKDPSGAVWIVERLFPFSHETMTMSAIVVELVNRKRFVICKGSFEALKTRCANVTAQSELAANSFAREGCYVLAVGIKELGVASSVAVSAEIVREDVEIGMQFAGLILFRNEVKPDSRDCILELTAAGIESAMLTGDSVYTGAVVAKQVGMIPPASRVIVGTMNPNSRMTEWRQGETQVFEENFAQDSNVVFCVTGEVYANLRSHGKLDLVRTKVFGRVSPGQKAEIVRLYSNENKVVAMCGDGGNDSGALRAAHAGLAINGKVEASVAAPFSTDSESLTALTLLIRESRAALCTSLASYRTLVVVGILYCVSKSVLLFQCGGYQAGVAYLYLDMLTTPLMLFSICHAMPSAKLAETPPEGSLLGPEMITAAVWTIFVNITFLGLADLIMVTQSWFVPFSTDVPLHEWQKRGNNYEAALIFLWSAWVYVDTGLVYSYGSLHRRSVWMNWRLMLAVGLLLSITLAVLFSSSGTFTCAFKVNCSATDQIAATESFVNHFLFYYEKIGGPWYGVVPSTEFPTGFKVGLFFIFMSMSAVHHVGYKVIVMGPFVSKYLRETIGWTDGASLCRKRRRNIDNEIFLKKCDQKRTMSQDTAEFQPVASEASW